MARRRSPRPLSSGVEEVRCRIEHWRSTRAKRSPMPERLWEAAVALAQVDGIYPVARALKVNYESLKFRAAAAPTRTAGPVPPAFVELRPPAVAPQPGGAVVELATAGGATLTVRLADCRGLDLAGLVAAFGRRS